MSENKSTTLEPTLGMTLLDAVPVIFFAASMIFVALAFSRSSLPLGLLFGVGALLSFLAGLGKVIWKFLLAIKNKNCSVFKKYFRHLMSAGFLLMLVTGIVYAVLFGSGKNLIVILTDIPAVLCLCIGLGFFVSMCVYGAKADMDTARANWTEEILNTVAQVFIFIFVIISISNLSFFSYSQESVCDEILSRAESNNGMYGSVKISECHNYIFFDGEGKDSLLVFYPGGLVNQKAYVSFMTKFAEEGIDAVLLKVPCDLAIYKTKAAKPVLKKLAGNYRKVLLGGHSLGGATASMYGPEAVKDFSNVSGLVLCGAYSTKQFPSDFSVISVRGEKDGVLRMNKYEECMGKLNSFEELIIPGGNHGNFGHYGFQKGDNGSSISADEQQELTVKFVSENLGN